MKKNSRIYVAGHSGLVGSAVVRELKRKGYDHLILYPHDCMDLRESFPCVDQPEYVFNCAAHAGGIKEAINNPTRMLIDNILIQVNIIEGCYTVGVKKLINLASSCIYPVDGRQPYKEEQVGTGKTDENWSYAIAKIAGIELCRSYHRQHGCNFISAIPCNVYGPNDNFDLEKSHVIPGLIRKFHEANGRPVEIWGNGTGKREFLYVDDLAQALVMLMENYNYRDLCDGVVNIGNGSDVSIKTLVHVIGAVIGDSETIYNPDKPNGVKSKLMDSSRIRELGWQPTTTLGEGIRYTDEWYQNRPHN